MKLITSNAKLDKSVGRGYHIGGLALAPHRRSGVNLCPDAGLCSAVCNLWFSGRTNAPSVREAMIRRSRFMIEDPTGFRDELCKQIDRHQTDAAELGLIPALRLNVASDVDFRDIIRSFPDVTFWDYTKVFGRFRSVPENYHLTYSLNERSDDHQVNALLIAGHNVSAIIDTTYNPSHGQIGRLPSHLQIGRSWWPIVDGDTHDLRLREFDGSGVIVGLRFKGSRKLMSAMVDRGLVIQS